MTALAAELAAPSPLQKRRRRFKLIAAAIYKDERHKSGRKISSLMVIRDVKHRWNFTEAMISRAVVLRKAIKQWVIERDEFHPLLLSDEHWRHWAELSGIFRGQKRGTLSSFMSGTLVEYLGPDTVANVHLSGEADYLRPIRPIIPMLALPYGISKTQREFGEKSW
ncbi:hypothetical protein B0H14DRAFT_2580912 [Mycena olivaceomarginata]|nr:hypothetical protein B0H14DRAFT_2580912 [Mycena olivaceomarginata]